MSYLYFIKCISIGKKVAFTLLLWQRKKSMTFDQWTEKISKGVCLQSDKNPKILNRVCDSFDDGFEEEESSNSCLEKN
jgi:hypothetical protein